MKIFFNAPLHGKAEYREHYAKIAQLIQETGNKVIAQPVVENELDVVLKESPEEAGNYYKNLLNWIKQADIIVFEVSFPSTSIGYEIALALQHSKPIIAFRVKGATRNVVLESIDDEKVQLIDYQLNELPDLVPEAIQYASEQQDTRFNFFISPRIAEHLDWVSKQKRLPRAVYLRRLIEENMESNKEYLER